MNIYMVNGVDLHIHMVNVLLICHKLRECDVSKILEKSEIADNQQENGLRII